MQTLILNDKDRSENFDECNNKVEGSSAMTQKKDVSTMNMNEPRRLRESRRSRLCRSSVPDSSSGAMNQKQSDKCDHKLTKTDPYAAHEKVGTRSKKRTNVSKKPKLTVQQSKKKLVLDKLWTVMDKHGESRTVKKVQGTSVKSTFPCPVCSKSFLRLSHLRRHFTRHQNQINHHPCMLCVTVCDTPADLTEHMYIHNAHVCDVCHMGFNDDKRLRRHKLRHSGQEPYSCSQCGKRFVQHNKYQDHLKKHNNEKPYACDECGESFLLKRSLVAHKKRHNDQPLDCPVCGKTFKMKPGLRRHVMAHEGIKPYTCEVCGKCFVERSELKSHLKVHYGSTEQFPCSVCGKVLTSRSGHHSHMRAHNGDRRYDCHVCHKKFLSSTTLNAHRRVHTGEKPHVCQTCGKGFSLRSNLLRHSVVHTGEKPYLCGICGRGFTQTTTLQIHTKRVHGYSTHSNEESNS